MSMRLPQVLAIDRVTINTFVTLIGQDQFPLEGHS